MKGSFTLNITIFGEKNIGKSQLINDYIAQENISKTKIKPDFISIQKTIDNVLMKLNLYEFSDVPERKKDIANHHCIIIMFDMTSRQSFEDVLDKWVKFLREVKYYNNIILFGTNNPDNKDALPMTDEEEVKSLIDVAEIKGDFYDIGNKNVNEKCDLIDNLIEEAYKDAKENVKQKDCIIY